MMCYRLFGEGAPSKKHSSDEPISVNDTINIFSVASGHLYERFLRQVWEVYVDIMDTVNSSLYAK